MLKVEHTPYEVELAQKHNVTLAFVKEASFLSRGLSMVKERAVTLHKQGQLLPLKSSHDKYIQELETVVNSTEPIPNQDDVARVLLQFMDRDDDAGLRSFMLKCGCKFEQVDRLVDDWTCQRVNKGIIRMRAGNMLRSALRRIV